MLVTGLSVVSRKQRSGAPCWLDSATIRLFDSRPFHIKNRGLLKKQVELNFNKAELVVKGHILKIYDKPYAKVIN